MELPGAVVAGEALCVEPPEMINAGELVLKRWEPGWAPFAVTAIKESLPEFQPFLPWADDSYDLTAAHGFIEMSVNEWAAGTAFNYAIFNTVGELVGAIGLMTRMGPGVLEIGYWMRTAYAGRGYMTTAVNALSRVALTLPGVDRLAIRHDATNGASAAVAAKAGFKEIAETPHADDDGKDIIRERRP